jgi:MYXO-CTERM domain-containing protein
MQRAWWSAALVLSFALSAGDAFGQPWAGIIDPTRAIDWSTAGAGAIPARTMICSTLGAAGQSPTSVQSVTVAQINAALAACPSGQAVLLNAGTYDTAGATIAIPSNVTLRGAGPTQTIIAETGVPSSTTIPVVQFGTQSYFPFGPEPDPSTSTAITGGTSQGSKSITVASANGITVGTLLMLTQSDLSYMTDLGTEGACDYCAGVGGLSGQTVQVTAVSGTSLTISDPLYIDYSSTPLAYPFEVGCTSAGLEDLHIYASNAEVQNASGFGYSPNINFTGTIYSWVKNVESDFSEGSHLWIDFGMHNTIRDSFFHDGYYHGPGATDDELRLGFKASANLVENNIFWRQHSSVIVEWGAAGNVLAYNYSTGNYHDPSLSWLLEDICFHGPHPMMNLFEGNISTHWQMDDIHGSSSHSTTFRNYSTGSNLYVPPADARGALQMKATIQESSGVSAYTLSYLAEYNNLVGIISASDYEVNNLMAVAELISPATSNDPPCLDVGYADQGAGPNPNATQSTMLYQGVVDCVTGMLQWQGSALTLPASFYLPSKPAFWGSEPWPPIGPDVTGGDFTDWANPTAATTKGHVNKIPALDCFNTATSNGTTNVTTFDAKTCYAPGSTPGADGGVFPSVDAGITSSSDGGTAPGQNGSTGPDSGSPGNGVASKGSTSGCGCRTAGDPSTAIARTLAVSLGLLGLAMRRRRVRPS